MDKRIVMRHVNGPLAGLAQIQGVLPLQPNYPAILTDPAGSAALVRVFDHYVLYREIVAESL